MRNLIMMSVFALGSMISFASNGEKEIKSEKLNAEIENPVTTESQEFFNHTSNYEIIAQIFVCGSNGTGTNWFETASGPNGTGCVDATQLAAIISTYETLYSITHPDACDVQITAQEIDPCIHP